MAGTDVSLNLTDFVDTRYKDYAKYVLYSRAIPSCIDGFKPSQRKVVWTANKVCRTNKIKTAALGGAVTQYANYHHGGTEGVASLMAATYSNNAPILQGEGNFGSRLVNAFSAPRYTHVKLSPDFDRYFIDLDILPPSVDPEDPEPLYYLPIIPWVLVNGASGIAIGYATEIQPRDPKVLAQICADYISGRKSWAETKAIDIPPYLPEFRGTIYKRDHNWACRGVIHQKSKTQYEITELPYGVEREKYIEFLDKMEEQGKIGSYEDRCADGEFRFLVKMPNSHDGHDFDSIKFFRLEKALSENITTIDELGRLKIFESASELLLYFCNFRLKQYERRFAAWIKRDEEEYEKLCVKKRFIDAVVAGEITFERKTKKELKALLTVKEFAEKHHDMLLNVRTFEFCDDVLDELMTELDRLWKDIATWKNARPAEWFERELKQKIK